MSAEIYPWWTRSQARLGTCMIVAVLAAVWTVRAQPAGQVATAPTFSVTLKLAFLNDLVKAAAPFEASQTYEVGVLGITREVSYRIRLTEPQVEIVDGRIVVPMKFHAWDSTGLVNVSGDARPELTLVYNAKTETFEARLAKAEISLGALGFKVGVEDLVKPIPIPGVLPADIDLGHKTLKVVVHVVDIVVGPDGVRIEGRATFTAAAKPPKTAP